MSSNRQPHTIYFEVGGIFLFSLVVHFLYSAYGFNPTDEGFTLAYSRRLLDGQVPHRDFIIIRPALSPMLHIPELLLAGSRTFWISRFVFFLQFACFSWFATAFALRALEKSFSTLGTTILALLVFMLGCRSFPAMAWHTVDGLFLSGIGLYLILSQNRAASLIGYFLIGAACLCKQNFLVLPFVVLAAFQGWRNWRQVLALVTPILSYGLFLILLAALPDAMAQLSAQTDLMRVGVTPFLDPLLFEGMLAGLVAMVLIRSSNAGRCQWKQFLGIFIPVAGLMAQMVMLWLDIVAPTAYVTFGFASGVWLFCVFEGFSLRSREIRVGGLLLALAWMSALSVGYNHPTFVSGLLVVYVVALFADRVSPLHTSVINVSVSALVAIMLFAFHYARTTHIYRDLPSDRLTAELGDVLPGASGIKTNPQTYSFFADMNKAISIARAKGSAYALIPDAACHWVAADQKNPLPLDWPIGFELTTPALLKQVTDSIRMKQPSLIVIVQKVSAADLSTGFIPSRADRGFLATVDYVKTHLRKTGETQYFELYTWMS